MAHMAIWWTGITNFNVKRAVYMKLNVGVNVSSARCATFSKRQQSSKQHDKISLQELGMLASAMASVPAYQRTSVPAYQLTSSND